MSTLAIEKPADAIFVIDAAAKKYADARAVLAGHVTDFGLELEQLRKKHLTNIRKSVAKCDELRDTITREINAHRDLFVKPKTMTLHGIELGLKKGKGKVLVDDVKKLIERIKAQLPKAQAEIVIKTTQKPVLKALAQLDAATLKKLGVSIVASGDAVYIAAVDTEVDKLVDSILNEGAQPEGEEDDES